MGEIKEEFSVKLLYLSLHNLLKKRYGVNKIVSRKKLYCELGKHFLVPKNLRDCVIKELENVKLIERQDRDNVKILDYELDIEEDANEFFKKVGLF